jgi:hypothetical protein
VWNNIEERQLRESAMLREAIMVTYRFCNEVYHNALFLCDIRLFWHCGVFLFSGA